MNFTYPNGSPFSSCGCSCNSNGYAPNDPRAYEPTAQNLSVGDTNTSVVSNGGVVPIANSYQTSGNHISGLNPITLKAGHKYKVDYTTIGFSAAATNPFGAKLQLNGVDVPGSAAAVSSLATSLSVSGTAIVSTIGLTADATLTLVGVSTTTATYQYKSLTVLEIE